MFIRKFLTVILIGIALAVSYIYRDALMSMLYWFGDVNSVIVSIRGYGLWGPAVLFILFVLQTFIAFIPGRALMVASGYIYGFSGGMFITWFSLVVGGQAAFWLARYYGRPFAEKWIPPSVLDRWDKAAVGQGIGFYVVTLIMPFFPNDAMCYVAGLGNMSSRRFLIANIIGRGIASLFTVLIGAFSGQIPSLIWIGVAVFIVLGIIGWLIANRYGKSIPRPTK